VTVLDHQTSFVSRRLIVGDQFAIYIRVKEVERKLSICLSGDEISSLDL
jgi:hypothetical protein